MHIKWDKVVDINWDSRMDSGTSDPVPDPVLSTDNIGAQSTSDHVQSQDIAVQDPVAGTSTDQTCKSSLSRDAGLSFHDLCQLPERARPKATRKRRKPPSYHLMSTAHIAFVEECTQKAKKKATKIPLNNEAVGLPKKEQIRQQKVKEVGKKEIRKRERKKRTTVNKGKKTKK